MKSRSEQNWGGDWTEEKLSTFEAYVNAYLTIMQATRKKSNGWPKKIIYFDGFAGSGQKENNKKVINSIFTDFFNEKENNIYKGSAERVLQLDKKFDVYYFIDLDEERLRNLENLLKGKVYVKTIVTLYVMMQIVLFKNSFNQLITKKLHLCY